MVYVGAQTAFSTCTNMHIDKPVRGLFFATATALTVGGSFAIEQTLYQLGIPRYFFGKQRPIYDLRQKTSTPMHYMQHPQKELQ